MPRETSVASDGPPTEPALGGTGVRRGRAQPGFYAAAAAGNSLPALSGLAGERRAAAIS